jgi:pimeloyl-ACP methyl ester carboxylesterase
MNLSRLVRLVAPTVRRPGCKIDCAVDNGHVNSEHRISSVRSPRPAQLAIAALIDNRRMALTPLEPLRRIDAGVLSVAYHEAGPSQGRPVLLMHGFPYDIHAYADVAPLLAAQGCRVIVPYLRGFGGTRFLGAATPRSGEQAALGADLSALLDALELPRAVLAGYDWGGRAACVVAALWPERCAGLLTFNSYNIQHIASAMQPSAPEAERRLWYQYYFHGERGRAGLAGDRRALCRLLWQTWSPSWRFDDATFERSAQAFDNPDFVDVVIHSYRHRFGLVAGDPAYAGIERRLAAQPTIAVPTISFDGSDDGVRAPAAATHDARHFSGPRSHRLAQGVGHNMPQESPREFADAVLELVGGGAWS